MLTLPPNSETPALPKLIEESRVLTIAFSNECPLISYKTEQQKANLIIHFATNIAECLSLLSVARNLSPKQISIISQMIVDEPEFKNVKPSEVCEAVKRGVSGKYGKHYEGIGIDTLYSWIKKYQDERFEEIERYRQRESAMLRNDISKPFTAILGMKEILQNKLVEKEPPAPLKRVRTEYEETSDKLFAEFENLVKSGAVELVGDIPFADYKGKKLNKQDYHNERYCEIYPLK